MLAEITTNTELLQFLGLFGLGMFVVVNGAKMIQDSPVVKSDISID
jgi:hypothetical protein